MSEGERVRRRDVTHKTKTGQRNRTVGELYKVATPYVSLYKISFHFKALLWESIIRLLPPPTCKAYPMAILLHDHCPRMDSRAASASGTQRGCKGFGLEMEDAGMSEGGAGERRRDVTHTKKKTGQRNRTVGAFYTAAMPIPPTPDVQRPPLPLPAVVRSEKGLGFCSLPPLRWAVREHLGCYYMSAFIDR